MSGIDDMESGVTWARAEAERLEQLARDETWPDSAQATQGVEFLRIVAPGSAFYDAAKRVAGVVDEVVEVAAALRSWADFEEAGFASSVPYEARYRIDAATDLMEQVQTLLADKDVHPAAAVMVAGAAFEEFLRSMVAAAGVTIPGVATITKYGAALKDAGIIDKNDAHQITSMAATRNDAAHGHFPKINDQVASLFVDRVNLFITQHNPAQDR